MLFIIGLILGVKTKNKINKRYHTKKNLKYYFIRLTNLMIRIDKRLNKQKKPKEVIQEPEPINAIHFRTNYNEPQQTI